MKKSDIINLAVKELEYEFYNQQYRGFNYETLTEFLLDIFLRAGMQPPSHKVKYDGKNPIHNEMGVPYGGFYDINKWEEE